MASLQISGMMCARPTVTGRVSVTAPQPARLALPVAARRSALVVRAEGEGEAASSGPVVIKPTKFADLKSMSAEEIDAEVEATKLELFFMRNKQASRQEVKTSNFRVLRKKVAQLMTAKRQLYADMNKRDFRSMERKKMLEAGEFVR